MDRDHLIWSEEHGAWWRPGGRGYTTRITEAGRYSKGEAEHICANANVGAPFGGGKRFHEIAIKAPEGL